MKLLVHKGSFSYFLCGMLEYLFVLLVVLCFQTPYAKAITSKYYLDEFAVFTMIILFISRFFQIKLKTILINRTVLFLFIYYIVMFIYRIMSGMIYGEEAFYIKFFVVLPLLTIIFVSYYADKKIEKLITKYNNIMIIISIISLFFWVFGSLLHIISPTGKIYAYWGSAYYYPSYYGLYFERQGNVIFGIRSIRNSGIFCEAPMYSSCLVIAIASELFLLPELNANSINYSSTRIKRNHIKVFSWRVVVLIVTLISTLTTTGLVMLVLMLFLNFLRNNPRNRQIRIIKQVATLGVTICIFFIVYVILLDKSTSVSWLVRLDDYRAGFLTWIDSPIFGAGFNNLEVVQSHMSSFRRGNLGFSNALFVVLVEGGLAFLAVYFVPIFGCIKLASKQRKMGYVFFAIIIVIEFSVAVIQHELLMLMILALFYSYMIFGYGDKI